MLTFGLIAWLGLTVVTVYLALQPKPCDFHLEERYHKLGLGEDEVCVRPLFMQNEKVDLYLYTSAEFGVIDLARPSQFNALTPLWNVTGIGLDEVYNATINVSVADIVDASGNVDQNSEVSKKVGMLPET